MSLPKEIDNLLQAYFGGDTSDEVIHALEAWMRKDENNPRIFAEYGLMDRLIAAEQKKQDASAIFGSMLEQEGASDTLGVLSPDDSAAAMALAELAKLHEEGLKEPLSLEMHRRSSDRSVDHISRATKLKARLIIGGGLAAVVAIGAAVALVVSLLTQPETPGVEVAADGSPIVATLTETRDAKWEQQKPGGDLRPGTQLSAGQRLVLTEGFSEITTQRGAVVILEAPAKIELIDNDNAIYLHEGRLLGICETDSSKGFLVRTPHMYITDLGTEFGVEVSEDTVITTVFDGKVELTVPGGEPESITANQTARLTVDGSRSDLVFELKLAEGFEQLLTHARPEADELTIALPGTGQGLAKGEEDPNWKLIAINGRPLPSARLLKVHDGGHYTRHVANDPARSQWLAFKPAEQSGDEHTYLIETAVELPQAVSGDGAAVRLSYMADNALRAVVVNGKRVALPDRVWLDEFAPLQQAVIDQYLKPGQNTFAFVLANVNKNGLLSYTGVRVAWELALPPVHTKPDQAGNPEK